jgi:uncharacterized protein YkwD
MAAIQLANGMGDSIDLFAGETLNIPGNTQWPGENYFWVVHVVRPGETLAGLSGLYGLTVDGILRVNAIADPDLIQVDQKLVVPLTQLVTLRTLRATVAPAAIAALPVPANADSAAASTGAAAAPQTSGTSPETPPAAPIATPLPPPGMPAGATDWPTYILARINQARAEHGLAALTLSPELTYAAQAHAEDCARRGWGSHVGSDGAVLRTRVERAGYLGRGWGENWVEAPHAERAFEWWYGEVAPNDPHRRNILGPRYSEVGIGIAAFSRGYMFVTDFGSR